MVGKGRIAENNVVELREQVEGWPRGRAGTVVAERGGWKLVEISDDRGVALEFISVPEAELDLLFKHSD